MVQEFTLGENDVLIISVPVGAMPPHRVKTYLDEVKVGLKNAFGEGQKMVLLPSTGQWDESSAYRISIIKKTT